MKKITPDKVTVGTDYLEIVQIFPFLKGKIHSTIQLIEPPKKLEESFKGTGMDGYLAYEFIPEEEKNCLFKEKSSIFTGYSAFFLDL